MDFYVRATDSHGAAFELGPYLVKARADFVREKLRSVGVEAHVWVQPRVQTDTVELHAERSLSEEDVRRIVREVITTSVTLPQGWTIEWLYPPAGFEPHARTYKVAGEAA